MLVLRLDSGLQVKVPELSIPEAMGPIVTRSLAPPFLRIRLTLPPVVGFHLRVMESPTLTTWPKAGEVKALSAARTTVAAVTREARMDLNCIVIICYEESGTRITSVCCMDKDDRVIKGKEEEEKKGKEKRRKKEERISEGENDVFLYQLF